MAQVRTVSLTEKQHEWLNTTKSSASGMLQEAINAQMKASQEVMLPKMHELQDRLASMARVIETQARENEALRTQVRSNPIR